MSQRGVQSLFSQRMDRALMAIFFLGAVVPVLGLGWVVDAYVLPQVADDSRAQATWIGSVVGIGVLVLSLFLAMRRISSAALAQMDADNRRLAALLDASRKVSVEAHLDAVATPVLTCATELSGAQASFLMVRERGKDEFELRGHGDAAPPMEAREALEELVEEALRSGEIQTLEGAPGVGGAAVVPLDQKGEAQAGVVLVAPKSTDTFTPEIIDGLDTLAGLARITLEKGGLELAQRNFFTYVTDILVSALDAHVDEREGHATNVARAANRLGHELGFDADRLGRLHFAALLHDIGMLKVDRSLHRNARATHKHTVLGARMLSRIRFWEDVAPAVLHHHEWFDGSGHPEGIARDAIPLESRIIAVVDAADAMRRKGLAHSAVAEELEAHAGTQFDPEVVAIYCRLSASDAPPLP